MKSIWIKSRQLLALRFSKQFRKAAFHISSLLEVKLFYQIYPCFESAIFKEMLSLIAFSVFIESGFYFILKPFLWNHFHASLIRN